MTRMAGGLEKVTHEKRLDEPALFSLNERAESRCEQNLQHAPAKVGEQSTFLLSWWIGQETVNVNYNKEQSKRFEE